MIYRGFGIIAASLILTACGGSSSSDTNSDIIPNDVSEKIDFVPVQKTIQNIRVVDALNRPLSDAEVVFTPVPSQTAQFMAFSIVSAEDVEAGCFSSITSNSTQGHTDAQGSLNVIDLAAGVYDVVICKSGLSVNIQLTINDDNAAKDSVIAVPVTVETIAGEDVVSELPKNTLIVAVSGVIYSNEGVVEGAQIALSGGVLTNGSIAATITDARGFYSLVINMKESKLPALQNASIQIIADGFEKINLTGQDFTKFGAFSGINLKLTELPSENKAYAYHENFETLYSDATCGRWISQDLAIEFNEDLGMEVMTVESTLPENLWHTHESGLNIINQAYLSSLVSLAPYDSSEGKVPDPVEGSKACWYGRGYANGDVEEGNFLNEYEEFGDSTSSIEEECLECTEVSIMNGGTSIRPHAGAVVSPIIDLSSETAPLALTFKTWWEIEAVNPNDTGFDLMSVEYQIEGEQEWYTLSRLNPLADPAGIENLESLPYTNAGFNQAPNWLIQDPIIIDKLAGNVFKLRFAFSTVDELYNGFRGWLLDDVKISHEVGNVLPWSELDRIIEINDYSETLETQPVGTEFSVSLNIKSLYATAVQLRFYTLEGEAISQAFAITSVDKGEKQDITLIDTAVKPTVEAWKLVAELIDGNGSVLSQYFVGNSYEDPIEELF
mgnify:CR=1 FL=1